jgi:hypothetical protein
MISIPTSYNNGTYSLTASSTYSYIVGTTQPDVTFKKTDSGFEVSNSIISLKLPYDIRYLIRSESTYYTVVDDVLTEIEVSELTSELFLNSGTENIPSLSLLTGLTNPEILYWRDYDKDLESGLVVEGTPTLPQLAYYNSQSMSGYSSIKKMEVFASDDVLFSISFDDGQTWKYFENEAWVTAASDSIGMTATTLTGIPESKWAEITNFTSYIIKCTLLSLESTAGKIYVNYN